jgi:hypothetical protein
MDILAYTSYNFPRRYPFRVKIGVFAEVKWGSTRSFG